MPTVIAVSCTTRLDGLSVYKVMWISALVFFLCLVFFHFDLVLPFTSPWPWFFVLGLALLRLQFSFFLFKWFDLSQLFLYLLVCCDDFCFISPRVGTGYPFPPLLLPCPFTSSSFALYYLFPISFSHPLYLFYSTVHPIPFYQNSPTPFPGVRS